MNYRFPIHVGDRVAIAPHHDLWMAGCRFGTVTSKGGEGTMGGRFYFIDLDTGRNVTLNESDLLGAVGDRPVPDSGTQHEMTLCLHEDCGYGDCSWLQDSPVPGTCNTHGNGEGRCQRDPNAVHYTP